MTSQTKLHERLHDLPVSLAPLVAETRWVVWRWELTEKGKRTKVPYQAARPDRKARTNGADTWGTYLEALATIEAGRADGIGFMLHDSEIAAFDIDDCRDAATGQIAPWAWTLIHQCASYSEATISGTGARVIGRARGPDVHRKQNWPDTTGSVETYRRATRYIVITGQEIAGGSGELVGIDAAIDDVVARLDARPDDTAFDFSRAKRQWDELTLPGELADLIRHGGAPGADRSADFHHAVCWLRDIGKDVNEIEALLAAYPAGVGAKYAGRLRAEIERCYAKAKPRDEGRERGQSSRDQDAGSTSKKKATPIPLRWHGDGDPYADRAWLVRDLVPEVGKGLLSGQWGSGKTFGVLDLSGSVMTGEPFAGRRVVRVGGVLFIAPEGASEIPIRLTGLVEGKLKVGAFARAAGGEPPVDTKRLPIAWIDECPRLVDASAVETLTLTAETAAQHLKDTFDLPLVLIIIDTVAAGARFDDENAAGENQKVMSALESLSHATGAFVMGVDHFGKMVETGTRGSSAKEAAADVVLAMLAEKDTAGNVSNMRMAVRKLRGGRTGAETPYRLEVVEIGRNREDDPITTCVVEWQLDREAAERGAPKERWPTSLKVFRSALSTALVEHGKLVRPFGVAGPKVRAVQVGLVRWEFNAAYPADGATDAQRVDAKRKAYNRAQKAALDAGLIVSREIGGVDHLWVADIKDE